MEKHYGVEVPPIGSLKNLRNGLANLDSSHFWTDTGKMMLWNPRSPFKDECRKLKVNIDDTQPTKYFTCGNWNCEFDREYISMYYATRCPCGKSKNREIFISDTKTTASDGDSGVFTVNTVSFLISDDLWMLPNVPGTKQNLTNLGIADIAGAELTTVTVGFHEIMDLLKGSLFSSTPLTDLFIHKRKMDSATVKSEMEALLPRLETKATKSNSKKMIVKAMIQKSNNKFLFVQAGEDFVDFLFSFLNIPLGGVLGLSRINATFGSIVNFYRSIENLEGDKYFKTQVTKKRQLKPKLPPKYLSKNQIFSLGEQKTPELYFYHRHHRLTEWMSPLDQNYIDTKPYVKEGSPVCFIDPKCHGNYVKGPGIFMVTDHLTITPLCFTSSLSVLDGLKIPLSDVDEIEFEIGLEEASSILRASLNSTFALTNGLVNSILVKQPKAEAGYGGRMFLLLQQVVLFVLCLIKKIVNVNRNKNILH